MQVFEEFARFADPPLGHLCGDAVVAFKALLPADATPRSVAVALASARMETSIDPDTTLLSMNTVARKAQQVRRGPVSEALLLASEPGRTDALYRRAAAAYEALSGGKPLDELVQQLERERQGTVEKRVSARVSKQMGRSVQVRLTKVAAGARRDSKMARRWLAFDADIDAQITVDGVTTDLPGFVHDLAPKVARGEHADLAWAMTPVAYVVGELLVAGNSIVNVTVPAAMAAVLGVHAPAAAAEIAERAAYISAGIPGAKARAESAATLACDIAAAG
jgi:hypothetical protein